jgi:hypothetical protein
VGDKFGGILCGRVKGSVGIGIYPTLKKNTQGYILQNPYFYLGFKTSFWNTYRDF